MKKHQFLFLGHRAEGWYVPGGGLSRLWRVLRGSESNVELELCEDVPLHRVVQPPPHLQLLFIVSLPVLSLGEELIDAWLQFLQNLIIE